MGEDDQNGGLWCSPRAKTSSPTSSACLAIVIVLRIFSASLGVRPVVGSSVMSLTVKMPNCMAGAFDAAVVVSFTIALRFGMLWHPFLFR